MTPRPTVMLAPVCPSEITSGQPMWRPDKPETLLFCTITIFWTAVDKLTTQLAKSAQYTHLNPLTLQRISFCQYNIKCPPLVVCLNNLIITELNKNHGAQSPYFKSAPAGLPLGRFKICVFFFLWAVEQFCR
jgi:hypothetical protein